MLDTFGADPRARAQQALDFLETIAVGGLVSAARISPDGGAPNGGAFHPAKHRADALSWIEKHASAENLYFRLNEPKREGRDGALKEQDIARLRGVAVDLDPRPGVDFEAERARLLALAKELRGWAAPPAFIVDSGNGIQAGWLFPEPLDNTPENAAAVKVQAKALGAKLGGDAIHDLARLLRLPFTTNFPNANKRARGRTVRPSFLLHLDATKRATLGALAQLAPPSAAAADGATTGGTWRERMKAFGDFDYAEVLAVLGAPEELTDHLRAAAEDVAARCGAISEETEKRYERDFRLGAELVRVHRITDPTELAQALFAVSPDKLTEKEQEGYGHDYAGRTVVSVLERNRPNDRPEDFFTPIDGGLAAAQSPVRRASRFFSASTLAGRPIAPRSWHVRDLIPGRTVTLLGGDGGTGKSLLALQLAVATVTGRAWIGRETAHGGALFLSAEDDADELHRRLADVLTAEGLGFEDLDRLTLRSLAGEDALLAAPDKATGALRTTALHDELDARLRDEGPALLILDTAADLHAGNENDRAQVRQFVGVLRGLAIRHACAVVLLAHPSVAGMSSGSGLSGSTAWNGSVRSRLYLERITDEGYEPNPDARRLTTKKANYARTGAEIGLTWRAGVFVAAAPGGPTDSGDPAATGVKAERVFLKLLRQFAEQGRPVSPAPSNSYAPTIFAKHPDAEGMTKHALRIAMEKLLTAGRVVVAEHGRGASKRRHLIEAPEGEK